MNDIHDISWVLISSSAHIDDRLGLMFERKGKEEEGKRTGKGKENEREKTGKGQGNQSGKKRKRKQKENDR